MAGSLGSSRLPFLRRTTSCFFEMNEKRQFEGQLYEIGGNSSPAWTVVDVPFSVKEAFGKTGHARIRGWIDGLEIEKTLMPAGRGRHVLVVTKALQKQLNKRPGDRISVILELNEPKIEAEAMGIDFEDALENAPSAKAVWAKYSPSHRREILKYINEAKTEATRARRIEKALNDHLKPKD